MKNLNKDVKKKKRNIWFILMLAPGLSVAQQSLQIEEIIVTAEKREQSLQQVPVAVSAFTGADLQAMGVVDIEGLAQNIPNTQISLGGNSNTGVSISMRGMLNSDPAFTAVPKVGIYIDGIYLARDAAVSFDMLEMERVEVLRGPQGTLWGRNTTGGAINIVTRKPRGEFGFKETLSIGNYDYYRSTTTVDTPKVGGISAMLTYMRTERDGMVKNSQTYRGASSTLGNDDTWGARAAVRWEATEWLVADYAYDKVKIDATPRAQQFVTVNPNLSVTPTASLMNLSTGALTTIVNPYLLASHDASTKRRSKVGNDAAQDQESDISGHTLTLTITGDRVVGKSITGYREYELSKSLLQLGGGQDSVPLFYAPLGERQHQFSQEFQVLGVTANERIHYVGGIFFFKEKGRVDNIQIPTVPYGSTDTGEPILIRPQSLASYSVENKSWAIYGQLDYVPPIMGDKLHVIPGARFTKDKRNARHYGLNAAVGKTWSNFDPTLTLMYEFTDNINGYAKAVSGFNSGIFNARAATLAAFTTPANEETVVSYELGLKTSLFDRRALVNVAIFNATYDDLFVNRVTADETGARTLLTNAGKARVYGVEFDATGRITPQMTIGASYGYVNFKYKEFITSFDAVTGVAIDRASEAKPSRTPKNNASAYLSYVFMDNEAGKISARLDAMYQGAWVQFPFDNEHIEGDRRTIVDARITWDEIPLYGGKIRLSAWGKNITNDKYRTYGVNYGVMGFIGEVYGDLRTYGVDIEYQY